MLYSHIGNPRPVFDLKAEGVVGVPDGMTIDADGNLWIALFDGGKVKGYEKFANIIMMHHDATFMCTYVVNR